MTLRLACAAFCVLFSTTLQADDTDWPKQLDAADGSEVLIYQPQVEAFSGNQLEGRAAVSVKSAKTGGAPVFGAIWFEARLDADRDARTAVIRDVDIADVRFADASEEQLQQLADFIEAEVESAHFVISIDQLVAGLDDAAAPAAANLKHDPPKILLSTEPAILVPIDGDPVFQAIDGSRYERVVNTPFLIARGGPNLFLYIGSNAWYTANDVAGPWSRAARVPDDVSSLVEPAEGETDDVDGVKIIIATEPTELIVSAGPPSWTPVEGMDLLYMDNTDSNAFLELSTQRYYVLLSGRWYRGEGLLGDLKWTHVPNDELPVPFSNIPEDSVNGAVLTQVSGTPQAREAVLDNTVPQTAAIDRDDKSFSVDYDGDPEFAPIEDIKVEYAQNTSAAVFRYGNLYYACDDGVWYVANSATGPWSVATEVPDAIYRIPTSNPHHNVTYVKVYDVTPEVVYVGYTPGYYGSYYYSGTVVYGTGWYYNPWYGPFYYPRYPTWGFHVTYNPWYGWGFGISWTNGPFRFTFTRHGAWWGVGGYRPYPRPYVYGGYRKTNININIDNSINIGGRDRPATRPSVYDRPENRERLADRSARPATREARPATGMQNNVLTDRSGNVYQRDGSGSWQQRSNTGQWDRPQNLDRASPSQWPSDRSSPSRPSSDWDRSARQPGSSWSGNQAVRPQLEHDFNARQRGASRTQNFQQRGGGRRR